MDGEELISKAFEQIEKYLRDKRESVVSIAGKVAVEMKSDDSPVTAVDKEIESDLRKILNNINPDIGILGEEQGGDDNKSDFWTIDPIDGTSHFIRGNPFYTCMVGLILDNQPRAGLIYNFENDEIFIAPSLNQAYCNGEIIHVSDRPIDKAMIEIECRLDSQKSLKMLNAVTEGTEEQVYFFGAGHGFTQVASGRIEARIQIEPKGKLYDFLPGLILVQAAGGAVSTIGQEGWDWRNLESIASNSVISNDLKQLVDSSLV